MSESVMNECLRRVYQGGYMYGALQQIAAGEAPNPQEFAQIILGSLEARTNEFMTEFQKGDGAGPDAAAGAEPPQTTPGNSNVAASSKEDVE